ncbi:hypothetical protein LCGC14_2263990 [marine sediment metagenome]|uniref:Uncharacterized protein n=1 Tax=marine sediment metagenome TaxID=412755 RepID=A0A0F9CYU3_9ZZZZ
MLYGELNALIESGTYDSKLPFPPYVSAQRTERKKASDKAMKDAHRDDERRLRDAFKDDTRIYIEDSLGRTITDAQFEAMFMEAWDDGHASGYYEVLYALERYIGVVGEFVGSNG